MAANSTDQQHSGLAYWSAYGQSGMPSKARVVPTDLAKVQSFTQPASSPWRVPLQSSQLVSLLNGFASRAMEDRWFVYADGPSADGHAALHFFRSWTGIKVAEVTISVPAPPSGPTTLESTAWITGITWETSGSTSELPRDNQWAKETVIEVCRWVLDVHLENAASGNVETSE
ncbi:hypothetical protein MMC13_005575 [Lambiella insularis]|nr:hypothetical protein [Lambiella insularis]